jgi:uncharacterized protein YjbJ (UPF0337 family)
MNIWKDAIVDRNQIEGIGHLVKGAVKESLGKMIGDAKFTSDGSAERANGEQQCAASADNLVGIDADRIKGIGHQLKGALKKGLGSIAGDPKLEADGIAEREAGKVQNAAGSARDTARDARKDELAAVKRIREKNATGSTLKHPKSSG